MECFALYCTGASHVRGGRPGQDRALCRRVVADGVGEVCVLVLADGHGSPEHFRSDIGAELAVETVAELLPGFMKKLEAVLAGDVSAGPRHAPDPAVDSVVRPFFARVMAMWCARLLADWRRNPADVSLQTPARAYGCTLLGAACCDGLWFAFQLGDGAVLALDESGELLELEPDPRCSGNVTTSMSNCGHADFRYRAGRDVPAAVLLCSDGLEKCYGTLGELVDDFMSPVVDNIVAEGVEDTVNNLKELLPAMSEQYTQDDMSLACCLDYKRTSMLSESLAPKISDRYSAAFAAAMSELEDLSARRERMADELENIADEAERVRKQAVLRTMDRQLAGLTEELDFYKSKLNG